MSGFIAARIAPGAHQGFIGMGHTQRTPGVELMENAKEMFRRAALGLLLQVFEVALELRFEITVIEVIRLHHVAVGIDYLVAVKHERAPRARREPVAGVRIASARYTCIFLISPRRLKLK